MRRVQWRKAVGRKIKVRLPDPNDPGQPSKSSLNPEVLRVVLAAIGESSNRDYPAILKQALEVLPAPNSENWQSGCSELVDFLKQELAQ